MNRSRRHMLSALTIAPAFLLLGRTASAGDCGKCTLLSGGAVATSSVCGSWAAKG